MPKDRNYSLLRDFCQSLSVSLFGVADISAIKKDFAISQKILKGFDRAVCLGLKLSGTIMEEIEGVPTKLYFYHYKAVNTFLDQAALQLNNFIENKGYRAIPVPASQIVEWQPQTAHLSHKRIGLLAGLGWIGRNSLLVNKDLGSQFRLVSVLTDMPLKTDEPAKGDCGACRLCVSACPAAAIKDDPADFDRARCFEKLKEFHRLRLAEQYICGVCVKACRGRSA